MIHGIVVKQMMDFSTLSFDHAFTVMAMLGDQTERMVSTFFDQNVWLADRGKSAMNDWIQATKKGPEQLTKTVEDSFANMVDYPIAPAPGKSGPPPLPNRTK